MMRVNGKGEITRLQRIDFFNKTDIKSMGNTAQARILKDVLTLVPPCFGSAKGIVIKDLAVENGAFTKCDVFFWFDHSVGIRVHFTDQAIESILFDIQDMDRANCPTSKEAKKNKMPVEVATLGWSEPD